MDEKKYGSHLRLRSGVAPPFELFCGTFFSRSLNLNEKFIWIRKCNNCFKMFSLIKNTNSEEIKWDFWNTYAISWPLVMCECNGILSFHIPSSCRSFFFSFILGWFFVLFLHTVIIYEAKFKMICDVYTSCGVSIHSAIISLFDPVYPSVESRNDSQTVADIIQRCQI